MTLEDLRKIEDLLGDLQAQAGVFAQRETHPWRGCLVEDSSYQTLERLTEDLKVVHDRLTGVISAGPFLEPFFGPVHGRSLRDLAQGEKAFEALAEATWLPACWTGREPRELEATAELLRTAAGTWHGLQAARTSFRECAEADPAEAQPVLAPALGRFRHWYGRLRPSYFVWKRDVLDKVRPKREDFGSLAELARLAATVVELMNWLNEQRLAIEAALGDAAGSLDT